MPDIPPGSIKLNVYQPIHISFTSVPASGTNQYNCNGANSVTFLNVGTATARIDKKYMILPGQSISFNGNIGEHLTNIFNFDWTTAGTKSVTVISKEYQ